ncbi:MAG: M13 family peptidase, partial [Acinetobacter sp.]|nr:M13 family peptidase [Acinetobacter sp.]
MKPILLKSALALALTAFTATVWADQAIQSSPTQKISGIDQQYIDQSVSANDDFYNYVNGTWLKDTEIPADKSRWGAFNELHELSTNQLHTIVEALSTKKWATGTVEQKVASLYASFMDEKTIEMQGITPLTQELVGVDAIQNKQELAQLMGHFSRIGVRTPFDISIDQDMKRSDVMIAGLAQRRLGLPDRDYYLKDDPKFVETRAKYLKHIERMLQLSGDQQAAQHAQDILKLETELAKIQWSNVQNRDLSKRYNIYSLKDLNKLSRSFDWDSYLNTVGVKDKIQTIQVHQLSYFKALDPVINKTPLNVWKAYFKWNLISNFSPFLNKAFVDESFEFFGKTLRDVAEQEV